jgi:hypothetical protein
MDKNICKCGRAVHIVVGLGLTSLAFWGPHSLWFLLGLLPVAAGLIGYCPALALIRKHGSCCCSKSCCCENKKQQDDKGKV